MRWTTGAMLVAVLAAGWLWSMEPQEIRLWPEGAPGAKATTEKERDTTTAEDRLVAGRPVIRLGNVTDPSLTVYRPVKAGSRRTAVLVFPGGGYRILALDLEGTEVCRWLNTLGITALLVKYRVPEPAGTPRYIEPLEDAERALSLARAHAAEWGFEPDRVGALGFSAGAHLAAVLSRQEKHRPDFVLLVYPAYLSVENKGAALASEVAPRPGAPPVFLVQTEDDDPYIAGTLLYYRALEAAHIPAEMHMYARGGHGYGLRPSKDRVTGWPELAGKWLREIVGR